MMHTQYSSLMRLVERHALKAMLWELAATPKPGLVDRANHGAHHDLDYFLMMRSAMAIAPYIGQCAGIGAAQAAGPLAKLWPYLRPVGLQAELEMRSATGGSNAHKGQIFSLGLLAAAYGRTVALYPERAPTAEQLCGVVADLCSGLVAQELDGQNPEAAVSYGQRLYQAYGVRGARGEAESGYATVRRLSLPILRIALGKHGCLREQDLVQALLALISQCEDTNILGRGGADALQYVQERAREILALGGVDSEVGNAAVRKFDEEMIQRHLSPGGSADLLAVTMFLLLLETPLVL